MLNNIKLPFLVRLALVLISILALGYIVKIGRGILAPMFLAFLLALVFLQFARWLERKMKFSRTFSTLTSVLIMVVALSGIVYFFSSQLSDFANDFPVLEKQITKAFTQLQVWVAKTFHLNFDKQMKYVDEGLNKLLSSSGAIVGVAVSMFSTVFAFFAFTLLFFIFILNYRSLLYNFVISVFNRKHFAKVNEVILEVEKIIKDYIVGLSIQIVIVSVLTSILLTILGVKYALLLGVLTGLLNIIPYIGIFTSCFFACLISFATGGQHTLFVLLGYVAIHAVDANITLPLVVGSKVKVNALFSFVVLLAGEEFWGISGMFLAIPFLAIVKVIFEHVEGLEPYGKVLGEIKDEKKIRRQYRITKKITLREKE